MLFVVALIGLLSSLAIPGLMRARGAAQRRRRSDAPRRQQRAAQLRDHVRLGFYSPDFPTLGVAPPGAPEAFLPPELAAGSTFIKSGYNFSLAGTPLPVRRRRATGSPRAGGARLRGRRRPARSRPPQCAVLRHELPTASSTSTARTLGAIMPEAGAPPAERRSSNDGRALDVLSNTGCGVPGLRSALRVGTSPACDFSLLISDIVSRPWRALDAHAHHRARRSSRCALLLAVCRRRLRRRRSPRPKQQFGFNIGDDYQLATYTQFVEYWQKLDKESDRMKVVEIGKTAEGPAAADGDHHVAGELQEARSLQGDLAPARHGRGPDRRAGARARQGRQRGRLVRRRPARHRSARRAPADRDGLPARQPQRCRDACGS